MRRVRRLIEERVDASFLQRGDIRLGVAAETAAADAVGAEFAAAVADEDQLDLLFEACHVSDVGHGDAAAAENADVRKRVEMGQGDRLRLHAAHGKAGHRAMRLVGERAEVGVDVGDQIVDENLLERAEVEAAASAASARNRRAVRRATACRSCVRPSRPAEMLPPLFHHDDEWLGFSLGDQVVHDQAGVALAAPAGFIFAGAVLQVEHRITLAGSLS